MKLERRLAVGACVALASGCASERAPTAAEGAFVSVEQRALTRPPRRGTVTKTAVAPQSSPSPRLYAKARFVWIQSRPDASGDWLGYLWTGGSVALQSDEPRFGAGCDGRWYAIEPRGFVCVDGKRATVDTDDPEVEALRAFTPNMDSAWPFRYGESLGLVRYPELPTPDVQARNETDLAGHLADVARARAGEDVAALRGVDVSLPELAPPPLPLLARTVHEARSELKPHSTVAFTTEARWGDRAFLLSADYGWIPKDRVKEFGELAFHGVHLGAEATLPLAFFRTRDRPRYARLGDRVTRAPGVFARLSFVELTGKRVRQDGVTYLETREPNGFVAADDAVVPELPKATPWGEPLADATPSAGRDHATWIDISVDGGWLLAFEGTLPRYATLISPGRGGTPVHGRPLLETSSTPLGMYSINTKIVTATMEAPNEAVHSDVPWVQNFTGPYALHTAYWHDDWGDAVSGGCVNLSPLDARYLFDFTEPKLPAGWHAVRREAHGPMTRIVLHP
ncbi:MAG TPA: L,D-transpeptidase [Polyangiaceae bacterium]|nr:L,D-transpeptidase [Polyangiaceae bacterium]